MLSISTAGRNSSLLKLLDDFKAITHLLLSYITRTPNNFNSFLSKVSYRNKFQPLLRIVFYGHPRSFHSLIKQKYIIHNVKLREQRVLSLNAKFNIRKYCYFKRYFIRRNTTNKKTNSSGLPFST